MTPAEETEWLKLDRIRGSKPHEPRYDRWDALPFPEDPGARSRVSPELARQLEQELWQTFLGLLPDDTAERLAELGAAISHDTRFRSERPSLVETQLAFLLGAGAANGSETGCELAGARRRQFVAAHPVISKTSYMWKMVRAIDTGAATNRELAAQIKASERIVRMFAAVPQNTSVAARELLKQDHGIAMLEGIPASWLPDVASLSADGWRGMSGLIETASRDLHSGPAAVLAPHLGATLAPQPGIGLEWLAGTADMWHHLPDLRRDMASELVLPAVARTAASPRLRLEHLLAVEASLLSMGASKLHRCLAIHLGGAVHDARMGMALADGSGQDGWGKAASDVIAPDGTVMRFLGSQSELWAEGQAMKHCVGSYGRQCAARHVAIMSLGRWDKSRRWHPSSTAELRMGGNGKLNLGQHYGPSNSPAPGAMVRAVDWWLAEYEAGRIGLYPGAMRPPVSRGEINLEDALGAAWRTPDAHAHRWDRWRRLLGTRAANYGDWLLSLPGVFLSASSWHGELCALAVDMDEEMVIARSIECAELLEAAPAP